MKDQTDLKKMLLAIDRRGYPAYKDLRGCYRFDGYVLEIAHVQSDPFAPPSRLCIRIPGESTGLPDSACRPKHRRIAMQDYLARLFYRKISEYQFKARGSGKSGLLSFSRCGQEILERSACTIDPADKSIRIWLAAGFPANGRTINSGELIKMLFDFLPECVGAVFDYRRLNAAALKAVQDLADDQQYIRETLPKMGLCAFIANGAILPRESGVSQKPLAKAVPFLSPPSMEVTLALPHAGERKGMGIKKGVTLIVGGGFHGKSTLLRALEMGVYNHIAGDGREYVITDETAVKIRAEDGRSIKKTDISLFIRDLPGKKDTVRFETEDASGSTSQAANVVEAMEAGTGLFLIDEDTCATNFMIRDELMQRVVSRSQEPIRPFIEQVRSLYEKSGVSCILVAGSSGLFFHKADCVLQMDCYEPREITAYAKQEAEAYPLLPGCGESYHTPEFNRCPRTGAQFRQNARVRVKALGKDALQLEKESIDLSHLEQLADPEQTMALGYLLCYAQRLLLDGKRTLRQAIAELSEKLDAEGLAFLGDGGYLPVDLARPRPQEIFACFNRYRGLLL